MRFKAQRPHIYAVTRTFFDREQVIRRLTAAKVRIYSRIGALVRKIAQNSMKGYRRKKISELTPAQKEAYRARAWELQPRDPRGRLLPLPPDVKARVRNELRSLRPLHTEPEPGKPPRVGLGLLQQHIYFDADPVRDAVVIGPINLPGLKAAEALEYGGEVRKFNPFAGRVVTYRFREFPYMRPALAKARGRYVELFRDALAMSRV